MASTGAGGAGNLAERGGGRRLVLEGLEPRLPAGAELAAHTALHEGPAHRRRVGLELAQFLGVPARQGIGNGGEDLRRLHQRPLEAADRRLQIRGMPAAVEPKAKVAGADNLGGEPADGGADLRIAERPAEARARPPSEVLARGGAVITILLCHAPEGGPRHGRCQEPLSAAVVPGLVPGTKSIGRARCREREWPYV